MADWNQCRDCDELKKTDEPGVYKCQNFGFIVYKNPDKKRTRKSTKTIKLINGELVYVSDTKQQLV